MAKPIVTLRNVQGSALTFSQLDTNFTNLRDATITVNGLVLDLNDTLTLTAGSGVIITEDEPSYGGKEITISTVESQNIFTTIATDGSSVTADDITDTLTISGGTAITTSGDAGTDSITIALDDTAVTPGTYNFASVTVDQQGRITLASSGAPVTSVSGTSGRITSSGGTTPTIDLATTGVTGGSYTSANITVDDYGRITAVANGDSGTVSTGDANKFAFYEVAGNTVLDTLLNIEESLDGSFNQAANIYQTGLGGTNDIKISHPGGTNPAVRIYQGVVYLNSETGSSVRTTINNSEKMRVDSSEINCYATIDGNGNELTTVTLANYDEKIGGPVTLTSGTHYLSNATPLYFITLGGNITVSDSLPGLNAGETQTLILYQDATGGRTVTWPAGTVWAGGNSTIASGANGHTIVTFLKVGGFLYGSLATFS